MSNASSWFTSNAFDWSDSFASRKRKLNLPKRKNWIWILFAQILKIWTKPDYLRMGVRNCNCIVIPKLAQWLRVQKRAWLHNFCMQLGAIFRDRNLTLSLIRNAAWQQNWCWCNFLAFIVLPRRHRMCWGECRDINVIFNCRRRVGHASCSRWRCRFR